MNSVKIITFSIENFRSIKDKLVLKWPKDSNIIAIFGSNAAGKTNIIEAFIAFCYVAWLKHSSLMTKYGSNIGFNNSSVNTSSNEIKLEIVFIYMNIKYTYFISYQDLDPENFLIIEESLIKEKEIVFCHNSVTGEYDYNKSIKNFNHIEEILNSLENKSSLLSTLLQKYYKNKKSIMFKDNSLEAIKKLISEVTIKSEKINTDISSITSIIKEMEYDESDIIAIIRTIDNSLSSISWEEKSVPINTLPVPKNDQEKALLDKLLEDLKNKKISLNKIKMTYKISTSSTELNFKTLSDGTKRYLNFYLNLKRLEKNTEGILLLDEIEVSFNELIINRIINILRSSNIITILTTHNTRVMEKTLPSEWKIISKTKDGDTYLIDTPSYLDQNNIREKFLQGKIWELLPSSVRN